MKKKNFLLGLAALSVFAGGLILPSTLVHAEESGNYPPIIEKLAQRFGLDREEVKSVFEEERTMREQERSERMEERLDTLVNDGVITEEQRQMLLQKLDLLRTKMSGASDFSHEERHAAMKQAHDEFKSWLEEQGLEDILPFKMMGQKMRGHHFEEPVF